MWTPKDPDAREFFFFDFGPQLAAGDALTGTPTVYLDATDGALVVSTPAVLVGNMARVFITGGTADATYRLRAECATVGGELLEIRGVLLVRR